MEQNLQAGDARNAVATLTATGSRSRALIPGEWYDVYPKTIKVELLMGPKNTKQYEWMAKHAYETCVHTYVVPKDGRPFEVFIPKIDNGKWDSMTLEQLLSLARKAGGEIATDAQLGLLWGQMITNGQKWEELLSEDYYMVVRNTGTYTAMCSYASSNILRGKTKYCSYYEGSPFMSIFCRNSDDDPKLLTSVPGVVRYK